MAFGATSLFLVSNRVILGHRPSISSPNRAFSREGVAAQAHPSTPNLTVGATKRQVSCEWHCPLAPNLPAGQNVGMKHWRGLAPVTIAVLAVCLFLFWPSGPKPCRATFELVQVGMTLAEIEAIVGGPPGAYCDRPEIPLVVTGVTWSPERWVAHDSNLIVYFDSSQIARRVIMTDPRPDDRSPVERMRDRLFP
jgi:hypothetical protein